jgi:DNA invertase Pin-like site-specific DNA recombinase
VNIESKKQELRTLNEDGTENGISKMVITILGVIAEMAMKMIRERQLYGIALAKANRAYKKRKKDTIEDPIRFLNKTKKH